MKTLLITALNVAFWLFAFYGVTKLICMLPQNVQKKLFDYRRKCYAVGERELKFYNKIHIRAWKDKLPQHNVDFDKRHLPEKVSDEYIERFLFITCRSEFIHHAIGIFGFLVMLFSLLSYRRIFWLVIYFICGVLNALGNLPFTFIQRYNRSRLLRYKKLSAKLKTVAQ